MDTLFKLCYDNIIKKHKNFDFFERKIDEANEIINQYQHLKNYLTDFKKHDLLSDKKFIELTEIVNYHVLKLNSYQELFEKQEQEKKQQAKQKFEKDLKKFFAYEVNYIYSDSENDDFLRISINKNLIETTKKSIISIKDAKKLYSLIENNIDISGYQLNKCIINQLTDKHLIVGNHKINIDNLHEIGKLIKNIGV